MNIFPIVKRFKDIKTSNATVILNKEMIIHEKSFRSGTIFFILGLREISGRPFLVLSKGSWQGLIDYEHIKDKIEIIN